MRIDLNNLTSRKLTENETKEAASGDPSGQVAWLQQQFMVPDEENGNKREIQPGEGIEIGPFPDDVIAKNFNARCTGKAVELMGWGKEKNAKGRRIPATRTTTRTREGKIYLWILRLRE